LDYIFRFIGIVLSQFRSKNNLIDTKRLLSCFFCWTQPINIGTP